jgi:hypothetical protein
MSFGGIWTLENLVPFHMQALDWASNEWSCLLLECQISETLFLFRERRKMLNFKRIISIFLFTSICFGALGQNWKRNITPLIGYYGYPLYLAI